MRTKINNSAFTLTELMTVVVIIGVLSAVAIPSYRKYVADAKISEGYANLDAIITKEIAFFNDNSEFYYLSENPSLVTSNMAIESNPSWDVFGYPIAIGANVYFSYSAYAGKIDSTGTELGAGPVTGNPLLPTSTDAITGASTPSGACS